MTCLFSEQPELTQTWEGSWRCVINWSVLLGDVMHDKDVPGLRGVCKCWGIIESQIWMCPCGPGSPTSLWSNVFFLWPHAWCKRLLQKPVSERRETITKAIWLPGRQGFGVSVMTDIQWGWGGVRKKKNEMERMCGMWITRVTRNSRGTSSWGHRSTRRIWTQFAALIVRRFSSSNPSNRQGSMEEGGGRERQSLDYL